MQIAFPVQPGNRLTLQWHNVIDFVAQTCFLAEASGFGVNGINRVTVGPLRNGTKEMSSTFGLPQIGVLISPQHSPALYLRSVV